MASRLPRKKSEAAIATNRKATKPRQRAARNNWVRERLDYAQMEAAKVFVDTILYKQPREGYKVELKFSVLPWSDSGYADLRKYINGKPTGQGLLVHLDHFPALEAAIIAIGREVTKLRELGVLSR